MPPLNDASYLPSVSSRALVAVAERPPAGGRALSRMAPPALELPVGRTPSRRPRPSLGIGYAAPVPARRSVPQSLPKRSLWAASSAFGGPRLWGRDEEDSEHFRTENLFWSSSRSELFSTPLGREEAKPVKHSLCPSDEHPTIEGRQASQRWRSRERVGSLAGGWPPFQGPGCAARRAV